VVAPQNPQELADAVRTLPENPELANELGRNGRRFVEMNFQWSKLTSDWLARLTQSSSDGEADVAAMSAERDTLAQRES
jgi:glycosyltransferase involved in cell wall biosynthesis